MAVTKQQLAQWSREFSAKNPDKVSGAGSTAQNITTKKSSVTKEQLSQWSREFDKKEAQRQAEQEQNTRDKALQQYTERHISDMGEVDARNEPSQAASPTATENISGRKENLSPFPSADAARERSSPIRGALLKGKPTGSSVSSSAPRPTGRSGAFRRRAGTCWRTWAAGPWPTAAAGRRS